MGFKDQKLIVNYFTTPDSESTQIDPAKRASTLISKRKRDMKAESKMAEATEKALRDGPKSITDYLAQNERAIEGRATVLRCRKKNFLKVL